ncbi:MAG: hypothetical protein AVDCRST_MAG33-2478 [uncultured Thermomicrobiales bacterium]|uniref:SGNH hydrolase-type esterase domain-containing protein n=1 Tax=uncultured Thermomicrobiales bacterium TaxID=1645740 RepID=A0A6J4V710_9BACT|nr:MAG: hypothetical protein AVDCRST_MAG33-2478 [uncultured Thermomicrobiales bacterium]
MTTYWTVVVIVIGAALLVLLAIWHRLDPGGGRRQRRWVALGNAFSPTPGARSWAASIGLAQLAEGIDLTSPGAGIADVVAGQLGPALAARPSVAVIWVGAADLLHGRPLVGFLRDLASVIGQLQRRGCAVLVVELTGAVPPGPGSGRPLARSFSRTLAEWESAIRDTCRVTGARLVRVEPGQGASPVLRLAGPLVSIEAAELERVGRALAGPIGASLRGGAGSSWASGDWDEPADPVLRARLGLPPVR